MANYICINNQKYHVHIIPKSELGNLSCLVCELSDICSAAVQDEYYPCYVFENILSTNKEQQCIIFKKEVELKKYQGD